MSISGFELNDKVKIKEDTKGFTRGYTGRVVSLLYQKNELNIGVDMDGDHFDPTPYYFNAGELIKL